MTTAKEVIRSTINMGDMIVKSYLTDLADADLNSPPVAGMNPIAWQLGHILVAERDWIEKIEPGSCPPLPEGFAAAHSKETAAPNSFKPVCTKDDYVKAWDAQHAATLVVLDALPEEKLTTPTGMDFAPTFSAMLNMIGIHSLMHAGQFVAVRKKLGKPVTI
jgi:uncharacterized damage-inducible protein DinB